MGSKNQLCNVLSLSMESYSENSNSSAKKSPAKLTLFDDLLQSPETGKSDSMTSIQEQEGESYPSDCESVISGEEKERKSDNGQSAEGEKVFEIIKNKLVSSLSSHGFTAQIEAINRSNYSSSVMNQVRYRSFSLYAKGMVIKRNGNANVKYAWYGASKDELNRILAQGFNLPPVSGLYGSGVYLSPLDQPVQSLQPAVADGNGARHMLLCRVILGNTEVIRPCSGQYKPSSEQFDSGVDNAMCPKKYIVWNGDMNTHILPEFIVRFRSSTSCKCEPKVRQVPQRAPGSDCMPFVSLIKDLARFLPLDAVEEISKHHFQYRKRNMTRDELIQRVRNIAGDKLLISLIKSGKSRRIGAAAKLAM